METTFKTILEKFADSPQAFDLFRVTASKKAVDISPNILRKLGRIYNLQFYKLDGMTMCSRRELAKVIMENSEKVLLGKK
jgi:hypothetical protein